MTEFSKLWGHQQHSGLSECWTGYHITKKSSFENKAEEQNCFDFPNADARELCVAISQNNPDGGGGMKVCFLPKTVQLVQGQQVNGKFNVRDQEAWG